MATDEMRFQFGGVPALPTSFIIDAQGRVVQKHIGLRDRELYELAVRSLLGLPIDARVETFEPELGEVSAAIAAGEPVAVASVIEGPGQVGARRVIWAEQRASGTLGNGERLDAAVDDDARGMLAQGLTGVRRYGEHGERLGDDLAVFVHSFAPPPRMLVFGAIDFAAAVARAGKFLGYRVTVCDARGSSRRPPGSPRPTRSWSNWPHRYPGPVRRWTRGR